MQTSRVGSFPVRAANIQDEYRLSKISSQVQIRWKGNHTFRSWSERSQDSLALQTPLQPTTFNPNGLRCRLTLRPFPFAS